MSGQPFRARFGFDADGQKLIDLADPINPTDGVNLQTLKREAGFHLVGRIGNLPSPTDPDPTKRPVAGRAYLIKANLDGAPVNRIAIWDPTIPGAGGIASVNVVEPVGDAAAITAAAGQVDAGKPFTGGSGAGAILDLTANADGTITGTVQNPGNGYHVGDTMVVPAASLAFAGLTGDTLVVVSGVVGATPGGWLTVDPHIWVKDLVAETDPPGDSVRGDLVTVTEPDHEQLKVWTGNGWHTLFDVQAIKGWIASLNLFQGTVQEIGGAAVGAIHLDALPDLTDPAVGAANASHYWVWVGTPGYTIKASDPNKLGTDLAGAVMQVGDWLQVAAGAAGSTTKRWTKIGGDLLARSRADVLYGLKTWVAGNYERGALVNYQGALWRATNDLVTTDGAPGDPGAAWEKVPLNAGVRSVATDGDLPATAPSSDVYLVLNSARAGGKPSLFSYDAGAAAWVELGGGGGRPMDLGAGKYTYNIGAPIGSIVMWASNNIPAGWMVCDGRTFDAATFPELQAALGATKIPDLRGEFVRGVGSGHALNSRRSWTTGRPRGGFTTSSNGNHKHSVMINRRGTNWKATTSFDQVLVRQDGGWIDTTADGAHTHTIYGGDAETAPNHVCLYYIIKAADMDLRLR